MSGEDLLIDADWLACVSEWIRTQPEHEALVAGGLHTALPGDKTFPMQLLSQLSDPQIDNDVPGRVRVLFQVDTWGGNQALCGQIAATTKALLRDRFAGHQHDLAVNGSIVAGRVLLGGTHRSFDTEATVGVENGKQESRIRPRARFDFTVPLMAGR